MIDDDEQVDRRWLVTIAEAFEDPATDFIGRALRSAVGRRTADVASAPLTRLRSGGSMAGLASSSTGLASTGC
jgi:hypothetical protein